MAHELDPPAGPTRRDLLRGALAGLVAIPAFYRALDLRAEGAPSSPTGAAVRFLERDDARVEFGVASSTAISREEAMVFKKRWTRSASIASGANSGARKRRSSRKRSGLTQVSSPSGFANYTQVR